MLFTSLSVCTPPFLLLFSVLYCIFPPIKVALSTDFANFPSLSVLPRYLFMLICLISLLYICLLVQLMLEGGFLPHLFSYSTERRKIFWGYVEIFTMSLTLSQEDQLIFRFLVLNDLTHFRKI